MGKRIIVGISGASGIVYGVRALELLRELDIETHLVMSKSAELTLHYELDISLEQLRFGDKVDIKFEVTGRTGSSFIAPMILFPLVENCFKHGISIDTKSGWIKIKLSVDRNELLYEDSNSKPRAEAENKEEISKGIGLKNVTKRLELIYPQKHSMQITEKENSFSCILKLELSEQRETE